MSRPNEAKAEHFRSLLARGVTFGLAARAAGVSTSWAIRLQAETKAEALTDPVSKIRHQLATVGGTERGCTGPVRRLSPEEIAAYEAELLARDAAAPAREQAPPPPFFRPPNLAWPKRRAPTHRPADPPPAAPASEESMSETTTPITRARELRATISRLEAELRTARHELGEVIEELRRELAEVERVADAEPAKSRAPGVKKASAAAAAPKLKGKVKTGRPFGRVATQTLEALKSGATTAKEIHEQHVIASTSSIHTALKRLERAGLVRKTGTGTYEAA